MASNTENKDVKTVDSGVSRHVSCVVDVNSHRSTPQLDIQSPVPSTPGRSTTLPSPAGAGNTALSSSPNTSKSRFANTPTADPIGTPAKSAVSSTSAASASLGLGTKSMPGSRRTSAIPGAGQEDGAFGLDKLSLGDSKGKEDGSVSNS